MESPYNRPLAANLIRDSIESWNDDLADYPELCGASLEMRIYTELKYAGYLTDEAMIPDAI